MSARLKSLILVNSVLVSASLGFITAGGSPSFAAIYMKLPDIKGEVSEQRHKGWIEIDSISSGAGRTAAGAGARPTASGGPGTISITRRADGSTAALMQACSSRRAIANLEIDVVEPQAMKYTFQDAIITSCPTVGGGGGGVPSESISFSYQKMSVSYENQDKKGAAVGGAPKTGYDLGTNKK